MNPLLRACAALSMLLGISAACAADEWGVLPPGAKARSQAGPADELIGFLLFDPEGLAGALPEGLRWRTLEEKAANWPRLKNYLLAHPERRHWAWSVFEVIGIHAARYDGVEAHFDGGHGGMAVWYPEVVRADSSDPRPQGEQLLALGSWVSDPRLVDLMRSRGFPARPARVSFAWNELLARGELAAEDLTIHGQCRLEGPAFVPEWAKGPPSFQTMWTPQGDAPTFEVVTWVGHQARHCIDARWRVSGTHVFARLFNDAARADASFMPMEFAYGYSLESALYERRQAAPAPPRP